MSRAASNAVPCSVRFASVPAAVGTPKGLTVSSRGQGHVSCARRPRIASLPYFTDPEGVELFGRARIGCRGGSRTAPTSIIPIRRFPLRLLTVFPPRGTGQRSNLFESHTGQTSGLPLELGGPQRQTNGTRRANRMPFAGNISFPYTRLCFPHRLLGARGAAGAAHTGALSRGKDIGARKRGSL